MYALGPEDAILSMNEGKHDNTPFEFVNDLYELHGYPETWGRCAMVP